MSDDGVFRDPARPGEHQEAVDEEFNAMINLDEIQETVRGLAHYASMLGQLRTFLQLAGFEREEQFDLVRDFAQQVLAKQMLENVFGFVVIDEEDEDDG